MMHQIFLNKAVKDRRCGRILKKWMTQGSQSKHVISIFLPIKIQGHIQ